MKYSLSVISTFALLCLSCSRTTMVSGRITNYYTGEPIAGQSVTLMVFNGVVGDSPTPKLAEEQNTTTDENGNYSLELSDKGIDDARIVVDGNLCTDYFYQEYSDKIEPNESKEINFRVDQITGKLKVVLTNQTGLFQDVFVKTDCDTHGDKGIFCFPGNSFLSVPTGRVDSVTVPVVAGRYVYVYWGNTDFADWNAPHIDSVYCNLGKTTTYQVAY
jgi:hypothetical protein